MKFWRSGPLLDDKKVIHRLFVDAVNLVWTNYENPGLTLTETHKRYLLNHIKSIPNDLVHKKLTALAADKENSMEIISLITDLSHIINDAINGREADHEYTNAVHFGIAHKVNDELNRLMFNDDEFENTIKKFEKALPADGHADRKYKQYKGLEAETRALKLMVGNRPLSGEI